VRLVGVDSLSPHDRIVLETAKHIREDFLHQSAFDPDDAYTRLQKQFSMLRVIIELHRACERALAARAPLRKLLELPVREKIARMRHIPEDDPGAFETLLQLVASETTAGAAGNRKGEDSPRPRESERDAPARPGRHKE